MRGGECGRAEEAPRGPFNRSRLAFWFGLFLLLCASAVLEWSRLYRLEFRLPGHGGGVLGYLVGPASVKWMGFTGSALIAIAGGVIGSALVFRFSWGQIAERIGSRLYSLFESRRERREIAQDIAMGKQAVREREELASRSTRSDEAEAPDEELRSLPRPSGARLRRRSRSSRRWPKCPRATESRRSGRSRCSANCLTASCRRSTCSTPRRRDRRPSRPTRWR